MGRQRGGGDKTHTGASVSAPVAGTYRIDTGTCELVADRFGAAGWVLMVNGVPSSHIDPADPQRLDFEYMHWMACLIDDHFETSERLRALHLGGGGCSLARYIANAYPHSRQVVVEIDGALAALVRGWFDLPRAPLMRLRVGEAREVTTGLTQSSRDLIVRDVFAGDRTPADLTTAEFTAEVSRVLAPGGLYLLNCGDAPGRELLKAEAATVAAAFANIAFVADAAMLKGRRRGNVVIAASNATIGSPASTRSLRTSGLPAEIWGDERVRSFVASARPLTDSLVSKR